MIKGKITKILISAGVAVSVMGVTPVMLANAQPINKNESYSVDSNMNSIQKAVINTTVQLTNGTANKYDMAVITGENGDNYTIITQYGVKGSIPKADLTVVKSGEGNQLVKMNETEHVIHVTTDLNVREQPDVHAGLLTTLRNGENIQVIGKEGEWLKINVNGQSGYVYNDFVQEGIVAQNNVTVNNTSNQNNSSNNKVSASNQSNSSNNAVSKSNQSNNSSNIVSKSNQNNNPSNVASQKTKTVEPNKESNNISSTKSSNLQEINYSTPKYGYINIQNGYVNMRSEAGTGNPVVEKLVNNEAIKIFAKEGNWYKVSTGNKIGWISGQYINFVNVENKTNTNNTASKESKSNNENIKNEQKKENKDKSSVIDKYNVVGTWKVTNQVAYPEDTNGEKEVLTGKTIVIEPSVFKFGDITIKNPTYSISKIEEPVMFGHPGDVGKVLNDNGNLLVLTVNSQSEYSTVGRYTVILGNGQIQAINGTNYVYNAERV